MTRGLSAVVRHDLSLLLLVTAVGLVLRLWLVIGYGLGDDLPYTEFVARIAGGTMPVIPLVGQYEFRPAWLFPIASGVAVFGWSPLSLVWYPLVTGAMIPLLSALWLKRHLPATSRAPLLCGLILATYPTLFVDSLLLTNETPMIFWSLGCVLCFGRSMACSVSDARRAAIGWALLAGLFLCLSYQTKVTAVPLLGMWLFLEYLLQSFRSGHPAVGRLAATIGVFLVPALWVQAYYARKTGSLLGNYLGEVRLYDQWIPQEYYDGTLSYADVLGEYPRQLWGRTGVAELAGWLHGPWPWVALALVALLPWARRRMEPKTFAAALGFLSVSIAFFLFMQFWPQRVEPYYLPNCFSGRPWRYLDPLAPTLAGFVAVMVSTPACFDRFWSRQVRGAVLAGCFALCGFSTVMRYHELSDRAADFRNLQGTEELLTTFADHHHFIDIDGFGALRVALGWPTKELLVASREAVVELPDEDRICVWTGGSRREGLGVEAAWTTDSVRFKRGYLRLVKTWPGLVRPWRQQPLQLWEYIRSEERRP